MAEGGIQLLEGEHAMEPRLVRAFELLSQTPLERLVSLTYKMGRSRSEELVHAMCLILQKRNKDACDKLMAHKDSKIASYLAEMVRKHGEKLNESHIGGFKVVGSDTDTLLDLARIFAVLVQERLCNTLLRDHAYRTALWIGEKAGLTSVDVGSIKEEVRRVCGPDVINGFCRPSAEPDFKTSSLNSQPENGSHPSSLRSSSICSSHSLEISSPTITGSGSNIDQSKPLSLHTPQESKNINQQGQALHSPSGRPTNICKDPPQTHETAEDILSSTHSRHKPCLDRSGSSQVVTSKNTNAETGFESAFSSVPDCSKLGAQAINSRQYTNIPPAQPISSYSQTDSNSEVEDTFYSFVILHEAEDTDEAARLKEKLESIISGVGATFSEDFEEPGRSTLGCIEDAINNAAFTLLLLTENFNTNLSETSTDSAIMNSLEKHHKINSVIPLVPQKNFLPKQRRPLVLRTKVSLDESSRAFERAAMRAMAPEKVAKQKKVWMEEQHNKKKIEQKKMMQEKKRRDMELRQQMEKLERMSMSNAFNAACHAADGGEFGSSPPAAWRQQPSYIHIENVQNVMIGDHSTMNIDHTECNSGDEDT